jgi:hypothetical protein
MMTIRNNTGLMPGGIIYDDPRTPAATWNDGHTFLDERAQQVITFRRANPSIYPEPEWTNHAFVVQQLVEFNCRRIGFNPEYCMDSTPAAPAPAVAQPERKCPECGTALIPVYCQTCGGAKINSWSCQSCKKDFSA